MRWTRVGNGPTVELAKPLFLARFSPGWVPPPNALCSCAKPRGGTKDGMAEGQGGKMDGSKEEAGLLIPAAVLSVGLTWCEGLRSQSHYFLLEPPNSLTCFGSASSTVPCCKWVRGGYLHRIFIKVTAYSLHKENTQNMQRVCSVHITQVYKWF